MPFRAVDPGTNIVQQRMEVKIEVEVVYFVTPCSVLIGYLRYHYNTMWYHNPEDFNLKQSVICLQMIP
jgi:hypothetical protein